MPSNPNKIVISDTACLIGLSNIGYTNILKEMYGSIIVTPEVVEEYGYPLPEWVSVRTVSNADKVNVFHKFLGLGESSAIALTMETADALLIVDDRRARQFAIGLGLEITGTLGLLIKAYKENIITDINSVVGRLREIGFRLPENAEAIITPHHI